MKYFLSIILILCLYCKSVYGATPNPSAQPAPTVTPKDINNEHNTEDKGSFIDKGGRSLPVAPEVKSQDLVPADAVSPPPVVHPTMEAPIVQGKQPQEVKNSVTDSNSKVINTKNPDTAFTDNNLSIPPLPSIEGEDNTKIQNQAKDEEKKNKGGISSFFRKILGKSSDEDSKTENKSVVPSTPAPANVPPPAPVVPSTPAPANVPPPAPIVPSTPAPANVPPPAPIVPSTPAPANVPPPAPVVPSTPAPANVPPPAPVVPSTPAPANVPPPAPVVPSTPAPANVPPPAPIVPSTPAPANVPPPAPVVPSTPAPANVPPPAPVVPSTPAPANVPPPAPVVPSTPAPANVPPPAPVVPSTPAPANVPPPAPVVPSTPAPANVPPPAPIVPSTPAPANVPPPAPVVPSTPAPANVPPPAPVVPSTPAPANVPPPAPVVPSTPAPANVPPPAPVVPSTPAPANVPPPAPIVPSTPAPANVPPPAPIVPSTPAPANAPVSVLVVPVSPAAQIRDLAIRGHAPGSIVAQVSIMNSVSTKTKTPLIVINTQPTKIKSSANEIKARNLKIAYPKARLTDSKKVADAKKEKRENLPIDDKTKTKITKPDDPELTKFMEDEIKMLSIADDDVVLGKMTYKAKFADMGYSQYLTIYQLYRDRVKRQGQVEDIIEFIDYHRKIDGNDIPILSDQEIFTEAVRGIKNYRLDTLRALANNYQLLDLIDNNGNGLLHIAALANNSSFTKWLIMRGININAMNYDSLTARDLAEHEQYWKVVNILKAADAR